MNNSASSSAVSASPMGSLGSLLTAQFKGSSRLQCESLSQASEVFVTTPEPLPGRIGSPTVRAGYLGMTTSLTAGLMDGRAPDPRFFE